MSQTAELLLAEIDALPSEERTKLLTSLKQKENRNRDVHDSVPSKWFDSPDPTPSVRWYKEHKAEYANQYIALEGDRLIAHSANAKEVIAAVHAAGLKSVFFTLVPPADELEFAGF